MSEQQSGDVAATARPVRVAMFPMMTSKNAATRLFCYQWVRPLAAHNIRASVHPPSSVRLYELLCEIRPSLRASVCKGVYWYVAVPLTRIRQLAVAVKADVVVIQRCMLRYKSAPIMESLLAILRRLRGRPRLVYQYDDALYLHANPRHYQRRFQLADVVLTGNEMLAEYARGWARDVRTEDTAIDLDRYHPMPKVPGRNAGAMIIGWAGSDPAHLDSMPEVIERVARLRDVRLVVIGPAQIAWPQRQYWDYIIWNLEREVENLALFDVGIMPLTDTAYNRAKEGYKLKQYMAMGLPSVASPVGKNCELVSNGVNGFLASDADEWVARLILLASDPGLRRRMGEAGRRLVEERYGMPNAVPKFARLIHELADQHVP